MKVTNPWLCAVLTRSRREKSQAERAMAQLSDAELHKRPAAGFNSVATIVRHVHGPLLLLTTARPELLEIRPGWGSDGPGATRLRLEALGEADTERLLEQPARNARALTWPSAV